VKRSFGWIFAVVLAAAFVLIAVVGPRMLISGMRLPPMRTATQAGIVRYEDVEFSPPDQKITLRAWWLPADEPRGAIVVVHGGGGNKTALWSRAPELCRELQGRHFDVLALDMRNHGESDDSLDGIPTFGPAEANDVIGAVDFIERRAPGLPIGAIGFSMGGNVVIHAAARDKRIRAVVTNETYTDVASVLPAAMSASSGLPQWLAEPILWFAEHLHGVPISKARGIDVVGGLEPGALFVIHNEADPIVPFGHAWLLASTAPDAVQWITPAPDAATTSEDVALPWGTHTKSYLLYPEEYVDKVVAFFESHGFVP
jgi:alpha/beta superfamily hydrolase